MLKIKNFWSRKDNIKKIRIQDIDEVKVLVKDTFDKGLLPKIYKELLRFNKKKTNTV